MTPAVANNIAAVQRVCFARSNDFVLYKHRRVRQSLSLTVAPGSSSSLPEICAGLTVCHKREAFELCAGGTGHVQVLQLLRKMTGFAVTSASAAEPWPPKNASLVRNAAILRITGNVGHDLLFEGLLDFFTQQELMGMPGFHALILEGFWFRGAVDFAAALASPSQSYSLTMLRALLAGGAVAPPAIYTATHYKMRGSVNFNGARLTNVTGLLCAENVFIRMHHLQAGEAGGVSWGNLKMLPTLRARVLKSLSVPLLSQATVGTARRRILVYTRMDSADRSRQLLLPRGDAESILSERLGGHAVTIVRVLPLTARDQVALFANAEAVVAPHGAAAAQSIFMKPMGTFVEISPFCLDHCLEGCMPSLRTRPTADPLSFIDAFSWPRDRACRLLQTVYGPFHANTGVRYHVLQACIGGPGGCKGGRNYHGQRAVSLHGSSWKNLKNYQASIRVDGELLLRLRSALNGDPGTMNASLVAPHEAVNCSPYVNVPRKTRKRGRKGRRFHGRRLGAVDTEAAPNIIFILADDWGSADAAFREQVLRPHAAPRLRTPVIDGLAASAVRLSQYYVQPICSPTRTALLSSRYGIHTGLQDDIIQAWARVCLPPKFGTLADALTSLGYESHAVGKWHAGIYRDACLPWRRGFRTFYGFLTGSERHYTKIQRIGRGNATEKRNYPDLRTQDGPVQSPCITPPFAPPPPPPVPCGLGAEPPCNYTLRDGYLPAGHDVLPARQATLPQAKAVCDASVQCEAITFELPTVASGLAPAASCARGPDCKMFFKGPGAGVSGGYETWRTMFKHAPPKTSQGDPLCYSTHLFTQKAVALISNHAANHARAPLFLYLALQDPHEPLEVPLSYTAPFVSTIKDIRRRTYAGMVAAVDESIGNVTTALRTHDMWTNSVLVVSSDNGAWVGYGGLNTPYRGGKLSYWEGGIRSIGFIVAPGRLSPAAYHGLFHITDWLPTLVTAAGGSLGKLGPAFQGIDGVDQWTALVGVKHTAPPSSSAPPRREILINIEGVNGTGVAAVRVGRYKLLHRMALRPQFSGWCDECNIVEGCFVAPGEGPGAGAQGRSIPLGGVLCCFGGVPAPRRGNVSSCPAFARPPPLPDNMLFDVESDPSEFYNLAESMPKVVGELLSRLAAYNATNTPCCICTGSGRTGEMDLPPIDGFWFSFRDQGPNPDPNCDLQNEPPPNRVHVRPW